MLLLLFYYSVISFMMFLTGYRNYCLISSRIFDDIFLGVPHVGRLGVPVGVCLESMFGGALAFCTLVFAVVARREGPNAPHPRSRGTLTFVFASGSGSTARFA